MIAESAANKGAFAEVFMNRRNLFVYESRTLQACIAGAIAIPELTGYGSREWLMGTPNRILFAIAQNSTVG